MIYKKIPLSDSDENVFLEAYIAEPIGDFVRKAILMLPGGGYAGLDWKREGEAAGMAFMPHGYNFFVLHYSINRVKKFPAQLIEAAKAIKHIKDNAEEYNINPEQVFAAGFSAGGHLCACCGTMWNRKEIYDEIDMPYGYNKPRGIILVYPVISGMVNERKRGFACNDVHWNVGSTFMNLLCNNNPLLDELKDCSAERFVTSESSPAFIVHTSDDEEVNVNNSLVLAQAYENHDLQFEMHIYPSAPHGAVLGNEITKCGVDGWYNKAFSKWVEQAAFWAENLD